MKKSKYLLLIVSIALLLTGCVKFNANMEIKKDKSMNFSIIYAVDTSMFGDTELLTDENKENLKKQGFEIADYSQDKMKGFTLTKKIKNIDSVSSDKDLEYSLSGIMEEKTENPYIFKVKKGLLKNTYKAKFKFNTGDSSLNDSTTSTNDSSDWSFDDDDDDDWSFDEEEDTDVASPTELSLDDDSDSSSDMDFSKMTSSMDLSFNVTLPYPAKSNNATKASDKNKKLTWNLTSGEQEYIEFEFEIYNMTIIYIACGVGVLIVGAVVFVIVKKGKNKPKANIEATPSQPSNNNVAPTNIDNSNLVNNQSNEITKTQDLPSDNQISQPVINNDNQVQSIESVNNTQDVEPTVVSDTNVESPQSQLIENNNSELATSNVENANQTESNEITESNTDIQKDEPLMENNNLESAVSNAENINQPISNDSTQATPSENNEPNNDIQKIDPFGLNG